jgi:NAD(P)-dependent dehydrogenase (short-subunit alcohol dehydrogenase family)
MARIFITGSADGLGQMAAELLIEQGHAIVLNVRGEARQRTYPARFQGLKRAISVSGYVFRGEVKYTEHASIRL